MVPVTTHFVIPATNPDRCLSCPEAAHTGTPHAPAQGVLERVDQTHEITTRVSRRLSAAFASAPASAATRDQGQVDVPRSEPVTPLMAAPNAELKLLRRVTNGITQDDLNTIAAYGYNGYLEYQLNAGWIEDSACDARLAPYTTAWPCRRRSSTRSTRARCRRT